MAEAPTNQEIADLFEAVAAALEILKKNTFRIRAYERAATSIRQTSQSLWQLWQEANLDSVPGLGETFIGYLDELFRTGKVNHFQDILKNIPPAVPDLMKLEGIGPKTAQALAAEFDLPRGERGYHKLRKVAQQGRIQSLPGFGEKSEQEILAALDRSAPPKEKRMLLATALPIAEEVMEYLRQSPAVQDVTSLGSLRRRLPTVGDIDLAVCTTQPEAVMAHLHAYPDLKKIIVTGPKMTSFRHRVGYQVDVKTQTPQQWGSMLQHFTGSKQHNIHLRTLALQQGWSMSEYGLKNETGKQLTFTDEKKLYRQLGLEYIPPELREDQGEIAAAQQQTLPQLITLADIRGDLHLHCNLDLPTSHDRGMNTVSEMLDQALALGYEYIALTDHNPPQKDLTDAERLNLTRQRRQLIQEAYLAWQEKHDQRLQLLVGYEVDITPDGSLALDDDTLQELDFAIASIHTSWQQSAEEVTARILKALAQPKVKILGHPTGRLLERRPGLEADWTTIFTYCAEHQKYLEINASPDRLDLPASLQRQAVACGAPLVINTDAHRTQEMTHMRYGVWQARRGWVEQKNVLNTQPWETVKTKLQE